MFVRISALLISFASLLFAEETLELFNGKDLQGWTVDLLPTKEKEDQKNPFSVKNGNMVIAGKPYGHIYTESAYDNYTLTVEYRYPQKKGNCGVMLHSTVPRFINNLFPRCIEVQLMHGQAGDFIPIGEDITGVDGLSKPALIGKPKNSFRGRFFREAEKPGGEWNRMVIYCQHDTITVMLNGRPVNCGTKASVTKGKIALQSEGAPVEFRKIELKQHKSSRAPAKKAEPSIAKKEVKPVEKPKQVKEAKPVEKEKTAAAKKKAEQKKN